MLRRLHPHQPDSFAFTPANLAWAQAQIAKYPQGRQASAIIPLLWRAQEQEGWLSRPAIEHVAAMLDMAFIRALEVATFYFMFQLAPVGSVAHVQVCGTTTCMICGAEDLIAVCKRRIGPKSHTPSADGKFSWEEVECMGACANAPMAQIGKDYYEDLTAEKLEWLLDEFAAGRVPQPGPQNGRFASEPLGGATSLTGPRDEGHNGSVALALAIGDTVRRIDGTEVPLIAPWIRDGAAKPGKPAKPATNARGKPVSDNLGRAPAPKPVPPEAAKDAEPTPGAGRPADATGATVQEAPALTKGRPAPEPAVPATEDVTGTRPAALQAARGGRPDDLKRIKGIGPKLEAMLHGMGFYHFDQVAAWSDAELAWVDRNLEGFKGRASRDAWVAQAKILAAGGETEFSARQD
jgi:NADH-quinone oxidoreductase subunit E